MDLKVPVRLILRIMDRSVGIVLNNIIGSPSINGKLKGTSAARRALRSGARSEVLGAPRRSYVKMKHLKHQLYPEN